MKKTLILLIIWAVHSSLFATGWHLTTQYYSLPRDHRSPRVEQVFLYDGFMKMVNGDLTTIFDLSKGEIIYINTQKKVYWKGSPSRFNAEVRADLEAMIEEKLFGVEEEQQETMRAMYKEMIDASFPEQNTEQLEAKEFFVRRIGDDDKVSDFKSTKYEISEAGFPLQTMWISPDLPIANDFDFINLSSFLNQLAQGAYAVSFESSQEYFDLLEKGYPVRVEIRRGDGSTQVSEVVGAKRLPLKPTDFKIPTGYNPSTLTDVGVWDGYM
jgi:hypothetical protein